jgi:hypothetical protein
MVLETPKEVVNGRVMDRVNLNVLRRIANATG